MEEAEAFMMYCNFAAGYAIALRNEFGNPADDLTPYVEANEETIRREWVAFCNDVAARKKPYN